MRADDEHSDRVPNKWWSWLRWSIFYSNQLNCLLQVQGQSIPFKDNWSIFEFLGVHQDEPQPLTSRVQYYLSVGAFSVPLSLSSPSCHCYQALGTGIRLLLSFQDHFSCQPSSLLTPLTKCTNVNIPLPSLPWFPTESETGVIEDVTMYYIYLRGAHSLPFCNPAKLNWENFPSY